MKSTILLFFGSILTFLIPIQGLLFLTFVMLLIDTIYAIYCSIKLKGLKSFKSALLRKGLSSKIFLYEGSIIIMYAIDKMIFEGHILGIAMLLSKSACMLWVYTEFKSIDENSQLTGNRPFIEIAKECLNFIKNIKKEKDLLK